MIISAFSALDLQGKFYDSSRYWFLDYGVSNHMTRTLDMLQNIQKYHGNSHIQTTSGNTIPITVVGDIPAILNDIFIALRLSANLHFV